MQYSFVFFTYMFPLLFTRGGQCVDEFGYGFATMGSSSLALDDIEDGEIACDKVIFWHEKKEAIPSFSEDSAASAKFLHYTPEYLPDNPMGEPCQYFEHKHIKIQEDESLFL